MMPIRRAAREDVPGMLEIYNDAVLHTTATYDYDVHSLEQRLEWFEEHERGGYPVFVAEADGRIAGWSSLSEFRTRMGYRFTAESSIYVHPDHRGQGLGRKLMEPLLKSAEATGLRAVIAGIDADNEASLRLHASLGFEKVAHLKQVGFKFGRWLDVVYMEWLSG